jgi:predicted nuclease with TOPRIM domain
MREGFVTTEVEIFEGVQTDMQSFPDTLRRQFMYPDEWSNEQEDLRMENEWLQAERDEVVEYIKTLKILSIYLNGKTSVPHENIVGDYFRRAEQNFPEYLQKELAIDIVP